MPVIKGNARDNALSGTGRADTIWGYGGDDMAYGAGGADVINLGPGNDTAQGGEGADKIYGGTGDDVLRGDAGNDKLYGGTGSDRLFGGLGNDLLQDGELVWGGGNTDTFQYSDAWARTSAGSRIVDFTGDRIDLSLIDANVNASGNSAFTFVGSNAFSGRAGELRYENVVFDGQPAAVQITGDTDGNRVPDFTIFVEGFVAMERTDFVL